MRPCLAVLIVLCAGAAAAPPAAADAPFDARAAEAVVQAVKARMRGVLAVEVESIEVTATPMPGDLVATPAPDARSGRKSLFSLTVETPAGPRRVGSAMATVRVEANLLLAAAPLARGTTLGAGDVVAARDIAHGVAFRPLPVLSEVAGARLTRTLDAGAPVTDDVLTVLPAVRSGQPVTVRAVVGGIVAEGTAVAAEHGRIGEVVTVVNPDSRRRLQGRVVAPGEVEVMHGS